MVKNPGGFVIAALNSEWRFFPVCTAHCLCFKMLISHLNDLQSTARSCLARWGKCVQRLLHSIAGTTNKQIYLHSSGSKFKSFSIALISLNKQKSWFCLSGVLSLISVRPVFSFNQYKKAHYSTAQSPPILLVWQLWFEGYSVPIAWIPEWTLHFI